MALLPQPLLDAGIALAIAVIEEEEEEEARKERRGARRRVWSRDWLLKRDKKSVQDTCDGAGIGRPGQLSELDESHQNTIQLTPGDD